MVKNIRTSSTTDDFPLAKKLRSSEPDLKVVLGSSSSDPKEDQRNIRWYHSPTLASKSKYIDTMLASPMKESKDMVISFPDISVEIWDDMMKFLDNPIAILTMNAKDVMKVATHYDKYDFCDGKLLCDYVLVKLFKATEEDEATGDLDLDLIVDSVVLASEEKANLDDAYKEGMEYIWRKVQRASIPYGRNMFTEGHMRLLAPLLSRSRNQGLVEADTDFGSWNTEMEKKSFPRRFVEENVKWLDSYTMHSFISHIELSGSNCKADGKFFTESPTTLTYDCDRLVSWNGNQQNVGLERKDDGWFIFGKTMLGDDEEGDPDDDTIIVETNWWKAPWTQNQSLPPQRGWKPVHPLAIGSPTIRYVLKTKGPLGL